MSSGPPLKIFLAAVLSLSAVAGKLGAAEVSNRTTGGLPLIIPQVQSMDVGTAKVSLPKVLTAAMPVPVNMENLAAELRKRGVGLKEDKNAFLRLEISPEVMKDKPEGYQLEIKANGIKITAGTPAGLFYGIQTLADIVRNTAELPECRIEDYPDLAMRGVYLNVRGLQSEQVPAFKQVMNFLAGLKLNTMVLEFADNFPLKSVKFKRKFTLSESDILDIKKHADELHMEIIPLLQCLSHVLWMNGYANFDGILERRADGTLDQSWNATCCPSNPEVQQLIAGVIRETAALLRPRYFHLGLDEVYLGPFHECEHCRKVPPEELFWRQVKILEEEAERNNVTPIFYHDIFLPQKMGGFKEDKVHGDRVIDRVPRKTVIHVWDYSNQTRPAWTEFFTDRNFPVLGASYCADLLNNQTLPQLMKQSKGALGCIITYWHYVHGTLVAPENDSHLALAATILAADYCWNCNAVPFEQITFDPVYEYVRRYCGAPEPFDKKAVAVNLAPQVNFQFGRDKAFPQFTPEGLDQLAAELQALPEKFNLLKDGDGNYYGIMLSGSPDDDQETTSRQIPFDGKAGRLAFLMTASRPQDMDQFQHWDKVKRQPEIGQLVINYRDGGEAAIPLKYNNNIIDWSADCGGYGCRVVNRGADKYHAPYRWAVIDWINPAPDKQIKSIVFTTNRTEGIIPVLLAVSVEDSTYHPSSGTLPEKCRNKTRRRN